MLGLQHRSNLHMIHGDRFVLFPAFPGLISRPCFFGGHRTHNLTSPCNTCAIVHIRAFEASCVFHWNLFIIVLTIHHQFSILILYKCPWG